MTTMIEKVARAIDPMSAKVADMLLEKGLKHKDVLAILPMGKARAAIEAMREPTDSMITAGIKREVGWEYGERGCPDDGPHVSSHASYTAMIDAALQEQQP